MINVMIGGIAGCNILKCEPRNKAHDSRIARLKYSVRLLVHFVKLVHEAIDNHLSWIKHRNNPLLGGFHLRSRYRIDLNYWLEAGGCVRFGSLADISQRNRHVRFTPES